ncbi:MAG: cytidylate kinase-like family protein [Bacteroides sp.]|nr:cytidylate kinase-like family protein [Bacteroidales bacterium]MBD5379132.1 cytidylate kinase-like family protein [Bacteroides sp.]MDE5809611.1 cytidylate kinase-like family protein [Muribaculaceae bacterium]
MEKLLPENDSFAITIGRQFGSGGRELGKALARAFGIAYYDKELLVEAARQAGLATEFFENSDEKAPSFLSGIFPFNMGMNPGVMYGGSTSISDDSIYNTQSDVMRRLASTGSCVIVGRTADYVLRDHPRAVHLFVSAPEDECVKRIMKRGDCHDETAARTKLHKINKLRSNFYNFYTDKRWGDSSSYDLCFDSSRLPAEDAVHVVAEYIRRRFGIDPYGKGFQY